MIKNPQLAEELRRTVETCGIRDTARAFHVSIPQLKALLKSEEFEPEQLRLAVALGLLELWEE
ncbi:hypothetical protein [Polyangium sp. 15x6]|uniref:hypothetical protein n=1 Tax=Polyangium sp. 15x6 TaxID=3042687 RepID=UPI00249A9AF1|nr:hypothetical protein [Polyangium sp. 15x6]